MKSPRVLITLGCLCVAARCLAQPEILERAQELELQGKFHQSAAVLSNALAVASVPKAQRRQLEFEADRLERIRRDFRLSKADLFTALKASVKDLTESEFEQWIAEGRFDSREIDGERGFMASSVSNLYFRYPELEARRVKPIHPAKHEVFVLDLVRSIKQAAEVGATNYVLPKRFRNSMTVTVKPDTAPAGEIIRAWLPIPRHLPFQTDFHLRSSKPTAKEINSRESFIRAVYFEAPARKGKATQFKLTYEYRTFGVHFALQPERVTPVNPNDPALAPYLHESPHVQFTPEIRQLAHEIAGGETNDYFRAKKCFDWIADQVKYSYAIEYSTIRNISDYCRTKMYGDCGQEALLFITLCRLQGIPARWQSGWSTFPGRETIHDWTEIYLAPYGWMPVDPYMGIWAMRYARTLTPEQQREIRDFYFGGLDQWRMIANSDHSLELSPPKRSPRSDTVDFQRGEVEWGDHNIYFDRFAYDFAIKELKLPK